MAPLLYLADRLIKKNKNKTVAPPRLLIGAGSKKELLSLGEFKKAGLRVQAVTEDGSFGRKGLVTDLLAGMSAKGARPGQDLRLRPPGDAAGRGLLGRCRKYPLPDFPGSPDGLRHGGLFGLFGDPA